MASPPLWKDYFDDPTFSDFTIRLTDRVVHAHRIVLCRGSQYFEKLLTGHFKESGSNEVALHEDDPIGAVEVIRHLYGLGFDPSHKNSMGEMHFLATTYVTAAKYQVRTLQQDTHSQMEHLIERKKKLRAEDEAVVNDFLDALGTVLAGTIHGDEYMRKLMVDYCFWNLPALTNSAFNFSDLLANNPDLGVEIITLLGSSLNPFEGSWYCDGNWQPDASPICAGCDESFPKEYMSKHRNDEYWHCSRCDREDRPCCGKYACCGIYGPPACVKWVWEDGDHKD